MDNKRKVGITGASGLLGSEIAKLFSEDGSFEVYGQHVSGFIPDILRDKNIHWSQGDLRDYHTIPDFIEQVDLVIHCAATVSFRKSEKDNMYDINVGATEHLVNYLLDTEKQLIHISSIATLGRKNGKALIDENDFWNDNLQYSDYAKTKFLAEMEVQRGISEGLDAMIVQPSIILAQNERSTSSSTIWSQIEKFPWLAPKGANGFVDVKDVARYVFAAATDWKPKKKFIISGHNLKYQQVYNSYLKASKSNIESKSFNPRVLLFLLPFVKFFFFIFNIRSEISRSAIVTTSKSYGFDNSKSVKLYGDLYSEFDATIERIASNRAISNKA